ncbi:lipopolysaccharide transport periplasmic protein LptA [Catenovulum sp. 2E275]|uniref:lipopolysaccharide transport periplasmic protein LptA n=1 Tax=Catenovulum sp. 2E275 TaxID=2980497 RepID=UPI0021CFDD54|nr:lipopolysaccharide transport periplasmic protein LptA [Catenovulum sp. 2E275]MCU4675462.1 lipopolysaccharide transport periplasmic protein LptA [Catenovulum sp. 2E275]
MLNKKLIFGLLAIQINAWALESDFKENIVIDAQNQQLDINTNTLTFSGKVEVSQGSLLMTSDKLQVIKGANPQQDQDVLIASGTPAHYQQELENGAHLTASANQIHYRVADRILTLTGNAQISQQGSQVSGDKIEYNLNLQKLVASSEQTSGNRVRTVLTPKSDN